MAAGKEQSIVIKKIKKIDAGHHGGAWKVAYADFVTAMMAFFLLLWLLSATTKEQKEGIADYFTPSPVPFSDGSGTGFQGGTSAEVDGVKKSDKSTIAIIQGGSPAGIGKQNKETLIEADLEQAEFHKTEEEVKKAMDDPAMKELAQNVLIKVTPEGLQIDIIDSDKHPMFQPGNAVVSEFGQTILGKLAKIVERLPNYVMVSGHTDAEPLRARGGTYTNWELSSDRANSARRYLTTQGLQEGRISKVQGRADFELLFPEEPKSPRNRRISMVLLRGEHMGQSSYMANRPGSLISTPKIDEGLLRRRDPAPAAKP